MSSLDRTIREATQPDSMADVQCVDPDELLSQWRSLDARRKSLLEQVELLVHESSRVQRAQSDLHARIVDLGIKKHLALKDHFWFLNNTLDSPQIVNAHADLLYAQLGSAYEDGAALLMPLRLRNDAGQHVLRLSLARYHHLEKIQSAARWIEHNLEAITPLKAPITLRSLGVEFARCVDVMTHEGRRQGMSLHQLWVCPSSVAGAPQRTWIASRTHWVKANCEDRCQCGLGRFQAFDSIEQALRSVR